jgi:hypothetical protein
MTVKRFVCVLFVLALALVFYPASAQQTESEQQS